MEVLFLDAGDGVVMTRSVNPLVVSGGLFGDRSEPLEAGRARDFHVEAGGAPDAWADRVDARVTDSRFAP